MSCVRFKVASAKGFSLVEVLIALVVLGVGLIGLARLQLNMLGGTAESVLHDSAVRLAEDKLESLRFELAEGRLPQAGSDEPKIQDVILQRHWNLKLSPTGLVESNITLQWRDPRTGEEGTLNLPAMLSPSALTAQAWLIQSGVPSREPLP
ncbi:MAG: prepilin-type N-terminal cleavage/methylation domain-containing protein [Polynucleobacter victoriensis]